MSKEINGTSGYFSIMIPSPSANLVWFVPLSYCLCSVPLVVISKYTSQQVVNLFLSHIFVIAFVFVCNCQIKENSLHLSLEDLKILLFYYTYSIIFLLFGVILWYSAPHLSVPHILSFCVWPFNSVAERGFRNRSTCAVHCSPWARLLPFMTWQFSQEPLFKQHYANERATAAAPYHSHKVK